MLYRDRRHLAELAANLYSQIQKCRPLSEDDEARADQLLDMIKAWHPSVLRPSVEFVFEHPDYEYEFAFCLDGHLIPGDERHNNVILNNVGVAFLHECIRYSREAASRRGDHLHPPNVSVGPSDPPGSTIWSHPEYGFTLVVTAHPTNEPGVYNITANIND